MSKIKNYKQLVVWRKSFELVKLIYQATKRFPKSEMFNLTSQVRRSAVSIPSNIAEGYCRRNIQEYVHFLRIALASAAELETQILLARELGFIKDRGSRKILELLKEVLKMLNSLVTKLKNSSA